ncbi:MAG: hypothetical protein HFG30_10015 [Eubacterium sp.]|jgi:hypothetical protein|nr:hypothetical protein [Eubacterium sp.]
MGFFKKLFGTAAVTGAAVGGALYVKKRKDEKEMNKDFFEDFDDSKAFEIQKDDNTDGTTKVTLTINKRKVKNMADMAADKVIDASDKLKDTVSEKIGEEKMEAVKDKIDTAKEKVSDVADMAKEKFYDAKDVVVETVGEDKIDAAKEKVSEVASMAKDKVSETLNKVTMPSKETEDFEDDLFEEDLDDDFLEDELKDI